MRMLATHYAAKAEPMLAKKSRLETVHVLPPLDGLSLASTQAVGGFSTATILTNFVVEDDCIKVRSGYRKLASRGTAPVWCLVPWYGSPNAVAAASGGELWNAQNGNRIKGGFTSDNWHWTAFSNLGEYDYTVMVNGADGVWSWNGDLTDDLYGDIPGTNLTSANPAVVTVGAGDIGKFAIGQVVFVSGAVGPGTLKANGYRKITVIAGNNLTLDVDTTGGATQASGVLINPSTGLIKEEVTCPTATWVSPNTLQIVVAHMNRLFFADNSNLAFYYLPLQQKSGALKVFPLNAVFRRGGTIRAMYTWTVDGGAGMDDKLVIFSTNGECVIYKGIDPDTDFSLDGIYRFDSPMSKHSVAQYGGELYVLISTGLVPMSTMLRAETERLGQSERGVTSLFLDNAIAYRSDQGWSTFLNPSSGRMFVNQPQGAPNRYRQMIRHMPKAVWTTWVNIPARCWNWLDPYVYFGDDSGNTYEMHPTHLSDAGNGIRVDVQLAWNAFKTSADKHFKGVTTYYSSDGDVHPTIDIKTGYDSSEPENTPDIGNTAEGADWNTAVWNDDYWATGERELSFWNGVKSRGHVGAIRMTAVLTNASLKIKGWDVEFEKGT